MDDTLQNIKLVQQNLPKLKTTKNRKIYILIAIVKVTLEAIKLYYHNFKIFNKVSSFFLRSALKHEKK